MSRFRIASAPLCLVLALALGCSSTKSQSAAPAAPTTARAARAPVASIAPDQFNYKEILGDPPADDSEEHRQEVQRMLQLQDSRTPEDVRRAKAEEVVTVFAFSDVLGSSFNPDDLPYTTALMGDVYRQAKAVSDAAKKQWKRTRPPLAEPRIHPCVVFENSASYPSGHATRGIVWAMLLSEIYSDKRDALMARGKQIGDDRFMAGMHYPSDVVAGQKLGAEIGNRLLADPAFRARLEEAKAECLRKSRTTHPAGAM